MATDESLSQNKRLATGPPPVEPGSCSVPVFVTSGQLQDTVQQATTSMGTKLNGLVQKTMAEFADNVGRATEETKFELSERINAIESRVGRLEDQHAVLQASSSKHSNDIGNLLARTETLERQLVMANQSHVNREDVESVSFDRPPNKEIIKVTARKFVTKVSVREALEPWLLQAGITPDQYSLVGHAPNGKKISIRFPFNQCSSCQGLP